MKILDTPISKAELIQDSTNFIDENAIKAVVDVNRGLIAVDSPMHYECEQLLLEDKDTQANIKNHARLTEILKAREEFCDYFFGGNTWHTSPTKMQKYYDGFVMMERL